MEYKDFVRIQPGRTASRRGFSSRWTGLLTSLAVGAIFLAIIGWSVFRGNGPPSSANGTPQNDAELMPEPVVTGPISMIAKSGKMYIEMTAKDDPNTLVGIIEADKVEPIDVNERAVESPRAWIFFADGRFGRVDADKGRFFMPDPNAAPESGLLEGNVTLRVYAPTESGEPPIVEGDGAAEPIGVATFDEALRFDFRRSRVSSAGAFVLRSPTVEMAGTNLTAVFNEVQQRLELVEVRRGNYVRFTPAENSAAEARVNPDSDLGVTILGVTMPVFAIEGSPLFSGAGFFPAMGKSVQANTTQASDSPEPIADIISYYHLTFLDGVDVEHQTQQLRGDQLDLWFRLVNNALPEGAIAPMADFASADQPAANTNTPKTKPRNDPAAESTSHAPPNTPTAVVTQSKAPTTTVDRAGVVTMRWTGPMRLQPLGEDQPDALREDDMALRLTAERAGFVEFADSQAGASAQAVSLEFGFTSSILALRGPGGNVNLKVAGSGELRASRMIAALGTGQIHIRGPGVMRVGEENPKAGEPEATSIRWSEQADFQFASEGDRLTSRLESAILDGNIEGSNGLARLIGSRLVASFAKTALGGQRLASLDVENGRAEDSRGGYLEGNTLSVEFADGTRGHDMDPVRIDARGEVRSGQPGTEIRSGQLAVALGRDLEGSIQIERLDASEAVVFAGEDGTRTESETLLADTLAETIELHGDGALLSYRGATILGNDIRIDGHTRRARVVGPGSFEQALEDKDGTGPGRVSASWTLGMSFDDYLGRVECVGDAVVISASSPIQIDTVQSQRVLVTLSPYDEASPTRTDPVRRLLSATAYGSADEDGQPKPASVESRVFADATQSRVEQLMYLEGMQINADNSSSELMVPSAGKLLLLDRRISAPEQSPADPGDQDRAILTELASGGPGLTRFEWRGGMKLKRIEGTASMKRSVKITHKNLASGKTYELHAERLDATIRETHPDGLTAKDGGHRELVRADATGAVYFGSADRELIADRLLYDAENGVVIGTAAPGNLVTLFDAVRGTPITSRAIRWDLVSDVISIERPGALVAPAGP